VVLVPTAVPQLDAAFFLFPLFLLATPIPTGNVVHIIVSVNEGNRNEKSANQRDLKHFGLPVLQVGIVLSRSRKWHDIWLGRQQAVEGQQTLGIWPSAAPKHRFPDGTLLGELLPALRTCEAILSKNGI